MATPVVPSLKPKKIRTMRWWKLIGIVVVGLIVLYGGWAVGVYAGGWRGPKTQSVSRIVPLPAVLINWRPVSLHAYLWQEQSISHYTKYLAKKSPGVFSDGQLPNSRQVAMTKIIRDWATEEVAREQNVRISRTDLDQAFNSQLLQGGDRATTTQAIKDLYNWTPEQFKQYVLRVSVIREKLREKLSFDDSLNTNQRIQAKRVYDLVKATPEKFADLAKQYSEDVYGVNGGDLGFFPRGEHAKEIDEAAFSVNPGEISELIHTKFGWHILFVEEKKDIDGQEQVHARQIFIAAPSVDAYITKRLNDWDLRILLSEFTWNEKNGQVNVRK